MPLILFAFVVRFRDGLPLSASTDFEHDQELQQRKQQLRSISKALGRFPEKGIFKGHNLNIYLVSSEGVSYMTVCHSSLPVAMAFCFLEDLRWEFTARFQSTAVALADRPYPFLEFANNVMTGGVYLVVVSCSKSLPLSLLLTDDDPVIKLLAQECEENLSELKASWDSTIQKLKQQYNQSGGPALEVTLAEVQEELRRQPPQVLTLEEVELTNGATSEHIEQLPESGQNLRLAPVTAPGILTLVLNIMCASLNLIRGVHLIEYSFQDDYEGIWNVVAFLLAFVCCVSQCHLYLFHSTLKKPLAFTLWSVIILCNAYLFGLRNMWQLLFHASVASLSTVLIVSRKLQERPSDCGV